MLKRLLCIFALAFLSCALHAENQTQEKANAETLLLNEEKSEESKIEHLLGCHEEDNVQPTNPKSNKVIEETKTPPGALAGCPCCKKKKAKQAIKIACEECKHQAGIIIHEDEETDCENQEKVLFFACTKCE